uniref:Putative RNA dependent RNA polymerase n=1 Tax=Hongshan virus TaxID=2656655 RepID=A0A5P8PP31_9VIRU|nr:MAG: putative RNA dependent RNA polymerase [Hongshan virus]
MVQGDIKGGLKSDALADLIDSKVPDEDKVEIYWTRPRWPTFLKKVQDNHLGKLMSSEFAEIKEIDDYTLSNNVEDGALLTEALTQLIRPDEEVDPDEITEGVIMMMALLLPEHREVGPLGEADYYDVAVADTSSGAVNLDPGYGKVGGGKYQMQSAAAKAAAAGCPLLNYEAHPKGREVIKKGKKVRQIVCEPYPIYLKNVAMFGPAIKRHGDVVDGECHGMARMSGGYLAPLIKFYLDEKAFNNQLTFDEFLNQLEVDGLQEDDKQAFEKSINKWSALVYMILMCARVTVSKKNVDDMAQVLAHWAWVPIKYKGHKCYYAYYVVASGNFWTLKGNTERHIAGYQKLSLDIQRHGCALGGSCSCYLCDGIDGVRVITEKELSYIVGGVIVGDDLLRRHVDLPVAKWIDHILGTKTLGGRKNAFFEQGDAAEFLRVSYGKDLRTFRDCKRVFAKLRWGMAKCNDEDFLCALQSASLELGPNREGNERLQRLWRGVGGDARYNSELQQRNGLPVGEELRPYTVEEVQILQAGVDEWMLRMQRNWSAMVAE